MQGAVNVHLVILSASVLFASSVVITGKQDVNNQEHTSSVELLAQLLRADLAKAVKAKSGNASYGFQVATSASSLSSGSTNTSRAPEERAELLLPATISAVHASKFLVKAAGEDSAAKTLAEHAHHSLQASGQASSAKKTLVVQTHQAQQATRRFSVAKTVQQTQSVVQANQSWATTGKDSAAEAEVVRAQQIHQVTKRDSVADTVVVRANQSQHKQEVASIGSTAVTLETQARQSWRRKASLEAYELLSRMRAVAQTLRAGVCSVLVWATLMMLIGTFYHHKKPHPPKLDPEGVNVSLHDRERLDRQRWRFGLQEWTEVPSLCCFSFFCAPIRWADTMRMAGFMNYFAALSLAVGLTLLGYLTLGLGFVVLVAVCAYFRRRMRQKFDIRSHASDWLAFAFCPWCSIVQEARQIEEAYLARHHSVHKECVASQSGVVWLTAKKV